MAKSDKPRTIHMDEYHVRPRRGPDEQGRWYWRIDWYRDGKDHARALGWYAPAEVRDAVVALMADGKQEEPKPREATGMDTITDLVETWVGDLHTRADTRQITGSTRAMFDARAKHLKAIIGDVRLTRVDVGTLERYRDSRIRQGAAPRTVAHELRCLRLAWRWGDERGHVALKDYPKVGRGGFKVRIDDDDFANNHATPELPDVLATLGALRAMAEAGRAPAWAPLAALLLASTGARVGEIASLTWGAVDLVGGWITLRGKTGARAVPIEADVVAALRSFEPGIGAARVLPVAPKTVALALQREHLPRACKAARVETFTPHGLRRFAVNQAIRRGVDVGTAAKLFGHSPEVMLRYYRKATSDDLRAAVRTSGLGSLTITSPSAGQVVR